MRFTPSGVCARRARGFTLLEVMLVMAIVSVMMGMVVLVIPDSLGKSGDLRREAERLNLLLELAGDEAVLGGTELGFAASEGDYRFYRYEPAGGAWIQLGEAPFQVRDLPAGIALELIVEGRAVVIGEAQEVPPVLLLSSGETTPFELRIAVVDSGESVTLESDGFSGIRLGDAGG